MEEIFNDALRNRSDKIIEYLRFNDVNVVDEKGQSLLHYACLGASNEVVSILITHGININIFNKDHETALFIAVRNKLLGITKMLINNGAKTDIINNRGESLICIATLNSSTEIIHYLLYNFDFDLTTNNLNHENILFYALKGRRQELFIDLAKRQPELLECHDYHNTNLLQLAIRFNLYDVIVFLLDKISIYAVDNEKNNSLMYLARFANSSITNLILKQKPILETKNTSSETVYSLAKDNPFDTYHLFEDYHNTYDYISYLRTYPLHVAILNRDYDILNYYQFDINKKDIFGHSILDYAKIVNDENILKILKNKN